MRMSSEEGAAGEGAGGRSRAGAAPMRALEVSAGGVVFRDGEVVVIVPRRRAADGSQVLGLPKGHPDEGESLLEAAIREIREETGIQAEPLGKLGEVRYWYTREGRSVPKAVVFFLFRYLGGDTADHDKEVEQARWMPLAEARNALSYKGERQMVALAAVYLSGSDPGILQPLPATEASRRGTASRRRRGGGVSNEGQDR